MEWVANSVYISVIVAARRKSDDFARCGWTSGRRSIRQANRSGWHAIRQELRTHHHQLRCPMKMEDQWHWAAPTTGPIRPKWIPKQEIIQIKAMRERCQAFAKPYPWTWPSSDCSPRDQLVDLLSPGDSHALDLYLKGSDDWRPLRKLHWRWRSMFLFCLIGRKVWNKNRLHGISFQNLHFK